jgi:ATP-dependent Clp protease ATP-binding subunit ClpC
MADGLEGFGQGARRAMAMAALEARELGSTRLGTEHLLLGLLAHTEGGAARLLGDSGVTLPAARRKAAEASGAVRLEEAIESRAGGRSAPGLVRSARAERAIGRAFRFSHEQRSREVRTEHLLLGVLDVEGTAGQVLRGLGVDLDALRAALEPPAGGGVVAAAEAETVPEDDVAVGAVPSSRKGPYVPPASCASCSNPLEGSLQFTVLSASDTEDRKRDVIVVSCRACGAAVGIAR